MAIHILSHPIVRAELSKLREANTTAKEFREGITRLSFILALESTKDLPEETYNGQSPVSAFEGHKIKPRIGLAPILRAGLGMTDALLDLFPGAPVHHLGLFREKVTLQPVEYYSKLPPQPTVDSVFLLDPLIATGGTACAAMSMLVDWGVEVKNIKLLCVLATKEGLQHVQHEFPNLDIWVAGVDDTLTQEGLICPGLGDTGDRLFSTPKP